MKLLEFSLHPSSVGSAQLESGGMGLNPIEVWIFFYPGFFSAKAKIPAHLLGFMALFFKEIILFRPDNVKSWKKMVKQRLRFTYGKIYGFLKELTAGLPCYQSDILMSWSFYITKSMRFWVISWLIDNSKISKNGY